MIMSSIVKDLSRLCKSRYFISLKKKLFIYKYKNYYKNKHYNSKECIHDILFIFNLLGKGDIYNINSDICKSLYNINCNIYYNKIDDYRLCIQYIISNYCNLKIDIDIGYITFIYTNDNHCRYTSFIPNSDESTEIKKSKVDKEINDIICNIYKICIMELVSLYTLEGKIAS